ncbi:hypothetical protein [Clostridium sp.]
MELINPRKEEYLHFRKLSAPRVLTSDGEEIKSGYKRDNIPEGALVGTPVSSGVIEGIARVITGPSKAFIKYKRGVQFYELPFQNISYLILN